MAALRSRGFRLSLLAHDGDAPAALTALRPEVVKIDRVQLARAEAERDAYLRLAERIRALKAGGAEVLLCGVDAAQGVRLTAALGADGWQGAWSERGALAQAC